MQADNKIIKHFHYDFPLPNNSTMQPYASPPLPESKKKNKTKLTKFTYYKQNEQIIKILFLDDERYIDQGNYPFTDPSGKVHFFKQIGNVERLLVTEAVYVGHIMEQDVIELVIKKINQAKISVQSSEIETFDDNFELINVGNIERFNQFMKVLKCNANAGHMSIRIIIHHSAQHKEGKVIDFQFFERETSLKNNKIYKQPS